MDLTVTLSPALMQHESGYAWAVVPEQIGLDALVKGGLSPRMEVYEDGSRLGPANAIFEEIGSAGAGRYALTRGKFIFTASDNSDPRTNGRQYELRASQPEDDAPLPLPRIMHVGITGGCNLTCRICRTEEQGYANTLSDATIDHLIQAIIPTLQELRLDAA
ncbi:MAG TPA: hypothetical protein VK196_18980, partial [Magnetospirillum sp.]|nr:hypothetical protein [Magnetospirillum sp.]